MRMTARMALASAAVLSLTGLAAASAQAAPTTPSAPVSSAIYITHAAAASHHHSVRPRNWWDGLQENWFNEYFGTGICARIDAAGALILGSGDCTEFNSVPCPTCMFSVWLERGQNGPCLYYDATGARDGIPGSYDLAGCSSDASDIWYSTSQNAWSQWVNGGDPLFNGVIGSMWAHTCQGTSCPMYSNNQDGTNHRDHWQALDIL